MWMRCTAAVLCLLLLSLPATASAEESAEENPRGFSYLEMSPAFVVNVGQSGRVGFLKAEVSLRVESAALAAVEQHMPALRHEMIMLLSSQSDEQLGSSEAREALRLQALEKVRAIVEQASGLAGITDLLFTSYIVQR